MSNLAIIPARGGSKRIPKKNIKHFLGKPIIAYSIETALKSNLFDEVVVSTDNIEIVKIAEQYGAKTLLRSEKNSDDYATLADVVDEVKNDYLSKGKSFESICCILATAPLINVSLLNKGLEMLEAKKADSVKPIIRFSYPIQRALRLDNQGKVLYMHDEYKKTRSQDLESAYFDAGMFYWMNFSKGLVGENKYAFEISELQAQDIDTIEDWELAEFKYLLLNKNEAQ